MPNTRSTLDSITSRNGHSLTDQTLAENISDRSPEISESPADDWSPLSKELIDTLPQVWTRGLLYLMLVFAGIVLPWSMLSKVDETGTARGRLEPSGATQRLDAAVPGTVIQVSVKEGQRVKAGQVLMELESDVLRSDLQQAETKLEGQQNRMAQLELIKNQLLIAIRAQEQQNEAQNLEKLAQIEQARQNLNSNKTAYTLQAEKLAQIQEAQANLTASKTAYTLQQEKLAQIQEAQENLEAKKTAYTLQQEKLAQIEEARQNINATKTAYILADSRYKKDMAEVERYRKLWQQGVVPEVKVVEKQQLAEESERLRSQAEAEIKLAEARLKEQQGSYDKMIHQADAEIKLAEARLKEQQGSYDKMIHQANADIKLAEARLKEQQGGYEKMLHQAKTEIEQAQSYVKEQQSGYESLLQAGKLAVLKSQEQLKDLQVQITTLNAEIAQSKSQIESLKFQLGQRVLRSPVEGTIFQLPIERAGAVVQPGQTIAQIAPEEAPLVLRANISSTESGFLRVGMPVKLKFDAYPFQDYGIIDGRLTWISPDSKITQTDRGTVETYELEITLDRTYIQAQNKRIDLNPGQTATAEVIVRQRRVIDFILDPFKKLQKDGLQL
ncbi:HlyD family efflux transporter periplasmic adaptor subunit [Planktothrix sp. FACHB-1355]|uniref:HlyD family efflux transporter periplasmic adaptor subunit n=1 Tax=Aerosakkonema funiforme FACHB-1375 TaxID=2949571 RepID=A0A926VFR4_9CYAN|nr:MULTISPECIES: HlyD family efflux transporter periplasmic adaptor subunit [Oscillatoriales]MBD2181947.1 HlyD family efflux transporter periplasmic adaptor subunit [Aerosakkonema funiforme FACHB-1375]MBD3558297.1 HlyD family efflux transporter periplasmic adaptor subunit [Planktothrix sp. FACHB-1355]